MAKKKDDRRKQDQFMSGWTIDQKTADIIRTAIDEYQGDVSVLSSAIGALICGTIFGWRGIRVTMSSTTFAKYERILKVRFRDVCPESTVLSRDIRGFRIAEDFGKFWQALSGGIVNATEGKIRELKTT